MIAAPRIPSFASSSSCPLKAMLAISSETVKPMPATAPPPMMAGQLSARRSPDSHGREASQAAVQIPIGLPRT